MVHLYSTVAQVELGERGKMLLQETNLPQRIFVCTIEYREEKKILIVFLDIISHTLDITLL